jgi:HEAT repeat protein
MRKRTGFLRVCLLQTVLLVACALSSFASISKDIAGQYPSSSETSRLLEALADARSDVRAAAARSLGKSGDPEAVDPLVTALGDPVDDVRDAAAASLRELGEPLGKLIHTSLSGWGKEWEARAEKARKELAARKDPRTFSPVARALGAWSVDVRVAAAKTLQALGDPRAVEPLIQAMGSE